MLSTIVTAVGLFIATNLDDLTVLSLLFAASALSKKPTTRQIVLGQFLGLLLLVVVSVAVAAGLAAVPRAWIGLLGLVPITIGLVGLVQFARTRTDSLPAMPRLRTAGMVGVTGLMLANGGDNVAVYAVWFRTTPLPDAILTVAVFTVMLAIWCALGRLVGKNQHTTRVLAAVGHWLIPLIFLTIGVVIVFNSGLVPALVRAITNP